MIPTPLTSLLIFLASMLTTSYTQSEPTTISDNEATLKLNIYTLSFIKNNEYFGPIVEGHTLGGYQLHPFLSYIPSENVTAKLGLFTRRYWAEEKLLSYIMPTFTLQYQKQAAKFLIGNIKGESAHQLIAPFYDWERTLKVRPETGLQMRYMNQHTFLDIWLDWLTSLDKSKNLPEEFVAGLSVEQQVGQISSLNLKIPLQTMLYHLGGQGIAVKDFSLLLGTIGVRINLQLSKSKFLQNIGLANYYVTSQYVKNINRPFKLGHAFFSQVTCQTTWFTVQGSYWNGYGFSSENLGHPLYQSIALSNKQITYQEEHRHLILLHIKSQYLLTNQLKFILHIDPYYDINHHLVEHEAGFYVIYKPCFNLAH